MAQEWSDCLPHASPLGAISSTAPAQKEFFLSHGRKTVIRQEILVLGIPVLRVRVAVQANF